MAKVTDSDGSQWSVRRRWWPLPHAFLLMDVVDAFSVWGLLLVLPVLAVWPFWLTAKFLGARWRLVVKKDGKMVDDGELVRGWSRSTARISELVAGIGDGSVSLPRDVAAEH